MGSAIRPILNKVVDQVQKSDRATGGGIILAGSSKEQPLTAKVIARGNGEYVNGQKIEMCVNSGDMVLIPKNSGTPFTLEGVEYIIIPQSEILAIIS